MFSTLLVGIRDWKLRAWRYIPASKHLKSVLLIVKPWNKQTRCPETISKTTLIAGASIAGLDAIVTRNKADFKAATIPVLAPAELLAQLS